jgi:asparagine synthase (glutamine-hydrolysing)
VAAYDQPSIDGLNTYFIAQATRQAGVKVALSGLGGDELFAGYPYFRWMARLQGRGARLLVGLLAWGLGWLRPADVRTAKLQELLRCRDGPLARYLICRRLMSPGRSRQLLPGFEGEERALPADVAAELSTATRGTDAVNAQSWLELSLYLGNMLLRDLDQMSMAHALEVREPLLDHVLVEALAALPGSVKLPPGQAGSPKGLLLDALPLPLPPSVVRRPKMGFVLPWERWLRDELAGWVSDVLTDTTARQTVGLDRTAVLQVRDDFLARRPGTRSTDVLGLVNLLSWVKRNVVCPLASLADTAYTRPSSGGSGEW